MKYKRSFSLLFSILILLAHISLAQNWRIDKIEIPEPQFATENRFGFAMATDSAGDIVVVGAPEEDAGQLNSGAAYIYQRQNGIYKLLKKIVPSDPTESKRFGLSLAIQDSIIVVGAPYDRTEVESGGAVYLFKKGEAGWQDAYQIKKIVPEGLVMYSSFGQSVAIQQNTIVIGSPGIYQVDHSGVVYVYEKTNNQNEITLKGKLMASEYTCLNGCSTEFGHSVAIGNNYIAVGAPYHDKNTYDDGAIFIFDKPKEGWQDAFESTVLHLKEVAHNAEIGKGLAIHKDMLITGARSTYRGINQGLGYAYLFQRTEKEWTSVYPVAALKAEEKAHIGSNYSVSLHDDYAVLCSPMSSSESYGGVYIFNKPNTGWIDTTEDIRIAPEELTESYFGLSVLPLHDRLLIGAPFDNRPALASGSVFELMRENQDWQVQPLIKWETPREEDASEYIFGDDVAIYENTMVVGAPKDNLYGAAYVYVKQGDHWKKVAKLTASDKRKKDGFGTAVNIFKDDIIVGATYADDEQRLDIGAAYIFTKPEAGWQDMHETAKFVPSDADGRFGYSVDLNQDFAAVGIKSSSSQEGGVYIFEKSDGRWISGMETIHIPPQAINGDLLGHKLDCSGTGVLVSAPLTNKVYLFEKNNDGKWNIDDHTVFELSKLDLGHAITKSFNLSLSLSKDYAVIGWPYAVRENMWGAGRVYVFRKVGDTWKHEPEILEAPTVKANEFFGADVDIDNDLLVIGANGVSSNVAEQRQPGTAYVYARNGSRWQLVHQVSAKHPTNGDLFGKSVGIAGTDFVVGAPHDVNDAGFRSGSAYIFNHEGPWIEQVSSKQKDGWYGIGQEIFIDVHFDDTVWVEGTPALILRLDTLNYKTPYVRGSGSKTITFRYVVKEGHISSDLAYNHVFSLSGDLFGRDLVKANKLLPHPGRTNSLNGHKNIIIDGVRPVLTDSLTISDTTNQSEVAIYWKSSEVIHQVDTSLIRVSQGKLTSWQLLDSLTLVTQIRPSVGHVEVVLLQGTVVDKAKNAALPLSTTFWYDSIAPRVSLQGEYGKDTTVLSLRLQFSEKIIGFSKESIILENGLLEALQKENDSTFLLQLYSDSAETLFIDLHSDIITDKAGNKLKKDQFWPVKGEYFISLTPPYHLQAEIDSLGRTFISWQDSATYSPGYVLHRAVTDDFISYDSIVITATEKHYIDITLLSRPETVFYYRVAGYNLVGRSAFSNTTVVDYSLYPPHNLYYSFTESNQLQLTWYDISKAEEGFIVERATDKDFQQVDRYMVPANSSSFVDIAIQDTIPIYWYRVRSYSHLDTSKASSVIQVKLLLLPPAQVQARLNDDHTIALNWKDEADNELGYLIKRSASETFDHSYTIYLPENSEAYVDHLTAGENNIYYHIAAYNALDTSEVKVVQVNLITAIPSVEENTYLIYPNPVYDKAQIFVGSGDQSNITYQIFSANGVLILSGEYLKTEHELMIDLDLSPLSAGSYYGKLFLREDVKTFKLIKR